MNNMTLTVAVCRLSEILFIFIRHPADSPERRKQRQPFKLQVAKKCVTYYRLHCVKNHYVVLIIEYTILNTAQN